MPRTSLVIVQVEATLGSSGNCANLWVGILNQHGSLSISPRE